MENCQLFSFVIVSYRNYKYIFECIDSVLAQDYMNIEIVISNDGSDDFQETEVKEYIAKHKGDNIKRVVTNNNETNLGTVKNINRALSFVTGEYIMMLAADDALYNNSVFSSFVNYFEKNKNTMVVTSQCAMYDIKLECFLGNAVQPFQVEMIKNFTTQQLYNELSVACLIPAGGCCYRSEVYEKYGYYDEDIFLIEDWSFFLRIVRNGAKIRWLDITAMKHRDGGISHGNANADNKAMFHYFDDVLKITEKEIFPYMKMLTIDKRKRVKKDYNNVRVGYIKKYEWHDYSVLKKFIFCIANSDTIFIKVLQKIGFDFTSTDTNILDKLSSKKRELFIFSAIMIFLYSVCNFEDLMPLIYALWLRNMIGYIGIAALVGSLLIFTLLILGKILKKVIRIVKSIYKLKNLKEIF